VDKEAITSGKDVVQIKLLYYTGTMGTTVQVRLDKESEAALRQLVRAKGGTASQAVRESILKAAQQLKARPVRRLVGIGCVDFGPGDLATNKERMRSIGVKSMGKGWRRPEERKR
jgi:hypothetical protein